MLLTENSKCIGHSMELFIFLGQASHSFTAQCQFYHFCAVCLHVVAVVSSALGYNDVVFGLQASDCVTS